MKKTIAMATMALAVTFAAVSCKKKTQETPVATETTTTVDTTTVATTSAVDPAIQQKVTDALKDFPSVTVEVVNGELTLTGNVSPAQARKIKESIDALKIGKYNNNLVVK